MISREALAGNDCKTASWKSGPHVHINIFFDEELAHHTSTGWGSELLQFLDIQIGSFHNEGHKMIRASLGRAKPESPSHKSLSTFFLLRLQ